MILLLKKPQNQTFEMYLRVRELSKQTRFEDTELSAKI